MPAGKSGQSFQQALRKARAYARSLHKRGYAWENIHIYGDYPIHVDGYKKQSNPFPKRLKKKSPAKRISAALVRFLKKQNPAMKKASSVRVQRLKGGVIKFTPES